MRHKNRGFTLIEVMVVLIIGIIIIAVAAGGVGRAFASNEASTETRNINELMSSVQTLKGANGFTSVGLPLLAQIDGIPKSLTNAETGVEVKNSWNGAVTLTGDANSFTLSYAGLPKAACIQIGTKMAEAGAFAVNDGDITDGATAATECAVDGNGNTLTFKYGS